MAQAANENVSERTPPYARLIAPVIRSFPNFDLFFIKSLRERAVQLLRLKPGDRVLDAGCGPGGSFPYLVDAVGPSGEVVGIEISPEMAAGARTRAARNGWHNVQVIESPAQTAALEGTFAGLVVLGAPDVYASPSALANLLPHMAAGASVVAFGAKLSNRPLGGLLSSLAGLALSKLSFASTPPLALMNPGSCWRITQGKWKSRSTSSAACFSLLEQ